MHIGVAMRWSGCLTPRLAIFGKIYGSIWGVNERVTILGKDSREVQKTRTEILLRPVYGEVYHVGGRLTISEYGQDLKGGRKVLDGH